MVEPVSITIAVVAAFFALISAIDAGHRLYATWKEKREKGNLEGVERYLHDMMLAWKKYNCMVAHMGRAFARELDGMFCVLISLPVVKCPYRKPAVSPREF
jgi:hypothetical protein